MPVKTLDKVLYKGRTIFRVDHNGKTRYMLQSWGTKYTTLAGAKKGIDKGLGSRNKRRKK
jgi:hypothetical protein